MTVSNCQNFEFCSGTTLLSVVIIYVFVVLWTYYLLFIFMSFNVSFVEIDIYCFWDREGL